MITPKHIIISRTDAIGDVVLTLPVAGFLKQNFPECKVTFLGRSYTERIISLSKNIDSFLNWDDFSDLNENEQIKKLKDVNADTIIHIFPRKEIAKLAKIAGIKNRIGTSHRLFHRFSCNKLVNFTRKKADLHESQLNFKLLLPLGINIIPDAENLFDLYGYPDKPIENNSILHYLSSNKRNIILHPRSKGSAREWGLDNFSMLIDILHKKNYNIIISGTKADGDSMLDFLKNKSDKITDLTGKLSLDDFIALISNCHALVAASTGPLHIASALGIRAIGLYAPMRPIHPGRWRPIGKNAVALCVDKECSDCKKSMDCACIRSITPDMIIANLY